MRMRDIFETNVYMTVAIGSLNHVKGGNIGWHAGLRFDFALYVNIIAYENRWYQNICLNMHFEEFGLGRNCA